MKRLAILVSITLLFFSPFLALAQESEPTRINVLFVVDTSGSMVWPAALSQSEMKRIPAELADQIVAYRNRLQSIAPGLNEANKERFFACFSGCTFDLLDGGERRVEKIGRDDPLYQANRELRGMRGDMDKAVKENKIRKADAAIRAMVSLLNTFSALKESNVAAAVGVVTFDDYGSRKLSFTQDLEQAKRTIERLFVYGATNMGSGLEKAFSTLDRKPPEGATTVIVLSDGRVTNGFDRSAILEKYPALAKERSVKIDTLGFGMIEDEVDRDLLNRLATETGGSYSFNTTLNELSAAFMKSGHQAVGNELIGGEVGVIRQGEEKKVGSFNLDYYVHELLITVGWPGSRLKVALKDDQGNIIPDTEYTLREDAGLLTVHMDNPRAGRYEVFITGEEVPEDIMDYNIIISKKAGEFRTGDFARHYMWYGIGAAILLWLVVALTVKLMRRPKTIKTAP